MKYLAQPKFSDNTVDIYRFPLSLTPFITLGPFAGSPNSVLIYEDSSGVAPAFYLFIAFISSGTGSVAIYDLGALIDNLTANPSPLATLNLTTDDPNGSNPLPIGMAVQPGSGDLYVGTTNGDFSYGTVNVFSHSRGTSDAWGPTGTVALSFNSSDAIAGCVSNLAFDRHGNLWLTTFDKGGNFLCCLPATSTPGFSQYLKFANGPSGLPTSLLSTQLGALGFLAAPTVNPSLFPFSGSEGIAFDPAGNLWLANNNNEPTQDVNPEPSADGGGGGSLLMIDSAWIDSLLYPVLITVANPLVGLAITTNTLFNGVSPVTNYYLNDNAQFGGLYFDGYTLYINDENNFNGVDGNPVVWLCDTSFVAGPGSPSLSGFQASFQWSNVTTTGDGNGSMSIVGYPYPNPGLTIRDILGDIGTQPDSAIPGESAGVLWESPDILVSNTNAPPPGVSYLTPVPLSTNPPTPTFGTTGTVTTGADAFISVRVTNFGQAATTGTEILKVYYGFASTGLDWPVPWDGSTYFQNQLGLPLGGVIGETQLPSIPGLSEIYAQIIWPANEIPDPSKYIQAAGGSIAQSEHFCLLARIESASVYPFGMCFPEQVSDTATAAALKANVTNNSAIAWRNIAIEPATNGVTFGPDYKLHVLGANYGIHGRPFTFGIQTLGAHGRIERIPAKIVVKAEGKSLERLLASGFEDHRCKFLRELECLFELFDFERGMSKIHLPAGELLPFTIHFTPHEDVRDFAVRVIQYAHTDGVEEIVGGQTFVFGNVAGF